MVVWRERKRHATLESGPVHGLVQCSMALEGAITDLKGEIQHSQVFVQSNSTVCIQVPIGWRLDLIKSWFSPVSTTK